MGQKETSRGKPSGGPHNAGGIADLGPQVIRPRLAQVGGMSCNADNGGRSRHIGACQYRVQLESYMANPVIPKFHYDSVKMRRCAKTGRCHEIRPTQYLAVPALPVA